MMKPIKLGLILSATAIFIFACASNEKTNTNAPNTANNAVTISNGNAAAPQPPAATDDLASARKIYSEKCVNCHKEGGVGGITQLERGKIKAPNFTSDRMKNDDGDDWIEVIENGAKEDGMPAFKGKLTDDEIKSLVKLIRKDFQGK